MYHTNPSIIWRLRTDQCNIDYFFSRIRIIDTDNLQLGGEPSKKINKF